MKLVIYEASFAHFERRLRHYLRSSWEIAADWGDEAWLRQELRGADALVANRFPAEWRKLARHLKALLIPGAGVPALTPEDLPAGCVMSNVYEHAEPIAEYVLYVLLRQALDIEQHAAAFREGLWSGSARVGGQPHGELTGRTVSILGRGTIGQAVAQRVKAMGMGVKWKWSTGEDPGFWTEADSLVIACPLTDNTRRLIGAAQLARLKDGAMVVNVSRAEIVEETALFHALERGRLWAALDVWYEYPEDLGEVRQGSRYPFHTLPNVFMTPHLSAWTSGLLDRRMAKIAENLDRVSRGEELERVVLRGNAV